MAKRAGNYRNNRPPKSGQFKPGLSGHPAGRPKGSRNRRKVLEDEANKTIAVTENGKRVRKRKWDLIITQQFNKAVGGDLKAAQYVTDQMLKFGLLSSESDAEATKLPAEDLVVFEEFTSRLRASQQADDVPEAAAQNPKPPTTTEEDKGL